jgi:hypothetical protein
MRSVEITLDGGVPLSDRIAELQRWLDREGIQAVDLRVVRLLRGRATFSATFAEAVDADRFLQAFSD